MITFIPYIVLGFVGLFVAGGGWSIVSNYTGMSGKIATLQHDKDLLDARLASYQRMLDRRNAAINASKCSPEINDWVRNPDKLPKPFRPFEPDAPR